jgi:Flp pilus assembly protein TadD
METQLSLRKDQAPEDYIRISQAWERAGAIDEALAACLKAVKQTTDHTGAHAQCARMYALKGELTLAVGHARLAWEQTPDDVDLTLLLGELYLAQSNRRDARQIFRIGTGHHPDDPRIQEGLQRASGYGR